MESLPRENPPAYVDHDPAELKLPSVPQQDLRARSDITLPNLQTVLASLPADARNETLDFHLAKLRQEHERYGRARDLPSLKSSLTDPPSSIMSPSDTASVMSLDDRGRSTSVVSLEDPAVRMAAEALSGLGNAGESSGLMVFESPTDHADYSRSRDQSVSSGALRTPTQGNPSGPQEPEPLLNLLVDAHPWVGGTINGSLSAYTTTKNYSPRFVQYGANLIERNIGTPVVHTVSTVGRRTGVESGLRRYLDSRRPSELEHDNGKRRRFDTNGTAMDVDRSSECAIDDSSPYTEGSEFLPAYRASKPPSYHLQGNPMSPHQRHLQTPQPRHSHSWSTQLMISTSGLGVALSESSLQSLTYCVRLLSKATDHVNVTMHALKTVLREFDQTQEQHHQHDQARTAKEVESGLVSPQEAEKQERTRQLAERIKHLCDEIWNTIKSVVNSVSTYAGGALPDNARKLVKGQLLSIPQRWRFASVTAAKQNQRPAESSSATAAPAAVGGAQAAAHRMIVFAEQGLDMMAQVSDVVTITLKSAEDWLESLGRNHKKPVDEEMTDAGPSTA